MFVLSYNNCIYFTFVQQFLDVGAELLEILIAFCCVISFTLLHDHNIKLRMIFNHLI